MRQYTTFVFQDVSELPPWFKDDEAYEFLGFILEVIEKARQRAELKKVEYHEELERDRHYFKPGKPTPPPPQTPG